MKKLNWQINAHLNIVPHIYVAEDNTWYEFKFIVKSLRAHKLNTFSLLIREFSISPTKLWILFFEIVLTSLKFKSSESTTL